MFCKTNFHLFIILLLLSAFPVFSRTAVSGQQQVKNIFYTIDKKSNLQVEDGSDGLGKNAINEIIKNGTQIKDEFRFSPGFVNGTLWVLIQKNSNFTDATNSQNFQILDLGPELIDRAELFCFLRRKVAKSRFHRTAGKKFRKKHKILAKFCSDSRTECRRRIFCAKNKKFRFNFAGFQIFWDFNFLCPDWKIFFYSYNFCRTDVSCVFYAPTVFCKFKRKTLTVS